MIVGRPALASLATAAAASSSSSDVILDGYASVMFITALNLLANGFHW